MKAFGGKLSDDEIKALVAYVRSLKNKRCTIDSTGCRAGCGQCHFRLLM